MLEKNKLEISNPMAPESISEPEKGCDIQSAEYRNII